MKTNENMLSRLKNDLQNNESLKNELINNPETVIKNYAVDDAKKQDVVIYRIVVSALSLTIVSIILGIFFSLSALEKADKVLPILSALGGAAIGALAGLLAPSPAASND